MHDCRKAKQNLVDLVFGELEADQREGALAEVSGCPSCSEEYQSMQATLRVFDQATEAAMPEESYWMGYEARLRTKLAEPAPPTYWERWAGWFAALVARPAIPVAATLILIIAISAIWLSRRQSGDHQRLVATTTPTPQPAPTASAPVQEGAPPIEIRQEQRSEVAVKLPQQRHARAVVQPKESAQEDLIATNPSPEITRPVQPDFPTAPASHFEKAQLLLRSFRNARPVGKGTAINLAYEKQQAHRLINDNILLRRDAEAKGYLPVEEALNSLEPLLLDIANLPDKPSRGEVQVIRDRIQKQEIIATLQVVSSSADRFSAPALLNQ